MKAYNHSNVSFYGDVLGSGVGNINVYFNFCLADDTNLSDKKILSDSINFKVSILQDVDLISILTEPDKAHIAPSVLLTCMLFAVTLSVACLVTPLFVNVRTVPTPAHI